jgi:hypothetical protein
MNSKTKNRVAILGLLGAATVLAQDTPLANSSVNINLPTDSPVALLKFSTDTSRVTPRGMALVLDLNLSLTLRNTSANRIHGITLRVVTQEVAMGGVGSIFQPGLNIGPGETFPVHIPAQLMRPAQMTGPLVQVDLDGVLFQDLTFYGPDRLHSRRIMTASEKEAQRDRGALKTLLAQGGNQALQGAILKILARQDQLPRLEGSIVHGHTVTTTALAVAANERPEQFAFVRFADSPVELVKGSALIAGSEARAPSIEVRNRSNKTVKYVELGWVLTDPAGRPYMAGSLPSTGTGFSLPAGGTTQVRQENTLSFSTHGQPFSIQKLTGFLNQVEFTDGTVWIPNRRNMDEPLLQQVLEPSAEEERLAHLYVTKGLPALVDELKKY